MNKKELLGGFIIAAASCYGSTSAQTLDLTLIDPSQVVTQGTAVVAFDAVLSNPSTTNTINIDADAFTTGSSYLNVDDLPFDLNAPLSLAPGQSSGRFLLFNVDLAPSTPAATYGGNVFSIFGGAGAAFIDLSDAAFSIKVDAATPVRAPEMDANGSIAALTFLAGCLVVLRARRSAQSVAASRVGGCQDT
jgi:hypothetical protein